MKHTTRRTAGQAHARAMGDALILLELIRKELINQAAADRREPLHWGHAGTAEHYRDLLQNALMQIRVVDDEGATLQALDDEVARLRDGKGD